MPGGRASWGNLGVPRVPVLVSDLLFHLSICQGLKQRAPLVSVACVADGDLHRGQGVLTGQQGERSNWQFPERQLHSPQKPLPVPPTPPTQECLGFSCFALLCLPSGPFPCPATQSSTPDRWRVTLLSPEAQDRAAADARTSPSNDSAAPTTPQASLQTLRGPSDHPGASGRRDWGGAPTTEQCGWASSHHGLAGRGVCPAQRPGPGAPIRATGQGEGEPEGRLPRESLTPLTQGRWASRPLTVPHACPRPVYFTGPTKPQRARLAARGLEPSPPDHSHPGVPWRLP